MNKKEINTILLAYIMVHVYIFLAHNQALTFTHTYKPTNKLSESAKKQSAKRKWQNNNKLQKKQQQQK